MKKRMCIWLYLYGLIKWDGVNVMTIHKSKGKEFDVVIVYEGRYQGHIIPNPDRIDQARLNLRVAVTRAKKCALILTPEENPCPLL
ncbi:MAG: 3'-5' exonuclease [Anaerovoracaceae bacterium]